MKCTICSKTLTGLVCSNKWCEEIHVQCSLCKKILNQSDAYEHRGFIFCEPHFDDGAEKVESKRQEVMSVTEHSTKSQIAGEWHNGGYKNMKVDVGGNPLAKIIEPKMLQDYENKKL